MRRLQSGSFLLRLLPLAMVVAACAPGATPTTPTGSTDRSGGAREPKTLTIATPAEPGNIALPSMGDVPTGSAGGLDLKLALHHRLATYDERGNLLPMLARDLPARDRGTWVLRPDGTMQTTYTLRPNASWHDGTPLTARDFAFAWTVTTDPDIPLSGRIGSLIGRIDTPDDHTLVMEWANTYPFANALVDDAMAPLPVHLLEATYRSDKDRFQQLGYWTREFVGTGPFRLAQWEPGSHITAQAYDGFYGGRAKVDTLVFRFIVDEGTAIANLLSGAVDGALARTLDFESAVQVRDDWLRSGKKPLFIGQTTHWRLLEAQLRPDMARPTDILDVRVRRGLLHALDRQALVDALLAGSAPPSDSFIPPDDAKWEWVKDATATYPHDPRRAQELFTEVGWRRAPNGTFAYANGEPVSIPIWTRPGGDAPKELAIMADNWKSAGATPDQVILSVGQARDNQVLATFPGFATSSNPLSFENTLNVLYGQLCPTEQTRWNGRNHGCYQNPRMDQIIDSLKSAIDPPDQQRGWREMVQIYTEELPVLPLYFVVQVMVFRDGVSGVRGDTRPRTAPTWNAHEWDVTNAI
ncbi:MAG: hypothetical protein HW416_2170 [Chloroflexi bacterium]|nr:hypothetical protein [Chloroflexota bacterium]